MRLHFIPASVLLFLLLLSGCVSLSSENYFPFNSNSISGCVNLSRENYSLPPAVFENLPSAPACFVSLVERYHSQSFSDEYFFTPEFFLQPEFFPEFEKSGLDYWMNPLATHWGAVGYGSFPSEKKISIRSGEESRARIFLHSGFGVRTFQGASLRVEFENPSDEKWVSVSLDENSVNGFLLGPTFPKFDSRWVRPVDVLVRVSPGAPSLTIPLRVRVLAPPAGMQDQWSRELGEKYYDATSYVGERVAFRVFIQTSE